MSHGTYSDFVYSQLWQRPFQQATVPSARTR